MRSLVRLVLAAGLLASSATVARAQTMPQDLRLATLEQLMNIEVTSAARREQRAEDVPAAVYVISRDEIRRSGLMSIPELLRLVPGVQVASINSNKRAVSVRGLNSLYSNKLLVMVDGRSIYNPAFSAVLWDTEDLMLEDVERIEVIRGPGGAMWGANAVNGVINIITAPSSQTKGGVARVSGGTFDSAAAFRYGGTLGKASYRAYVQGSAHGDSVLPSGGPANDNWHSVTSGFRTDWASGPHAVMFQGSVASGRQRPLWFDLRAGVPAGSAGANALSETQVADVLGRWTRTSANGSSLQVQAYFDMSRRSEAIGTYDRDTWDIDAQYHDTRGAHNIVVGGGYRHIAEGILGRDPYVFTPGQARSILGNGFVQDSITMGPKVEVTLGAKYESNTFASSGFQPSVRGLWKVAARQRIWAAASRALRTPSIIDRGLHVTYPVSVVPAAALTPSMAVLQSNPAALGLPPGLPILVGAVGNPDIQREQFVNVEAGYRVSVGSMVTVDAVGFTGRYDGLQTYEPLPPAIAFVGGAPAVTLLTQYQNRLRARTRGAELVGRLQLTDTWEADATFSAFGASSDPNGSLDPRATDFDGRAPRYQWRAHSALPLGARGQADVHLLYVGPIRTLAVSGYTRLDTRVEWRLTGQTSLVASGQNLLQDSHAEFFGHETNMQSTLMPRSATLTLAWRF